MGQDQCFIPASLDLPLAYHKVKAYGQDPKQQWPIIFQGNWLLIGNNNGTIWGWRGKDRQRERKSRREAEGSIKNDWSMSHSRRIGWTGIETERDHNLPTSPLELTDCFHSCLHPFLPSFNLFSFFSSFLFSLSTIFVYFVFSFFSTSFFFLSLLSLLSFCHFVMTLYAAPKLC